MALFEPKPRVAILGARGIGQVHARLFHSLGADVCAVLGSTMRTSMQVAEQLRKSLGISPMPFDNLEMLIEEAQPNALSICTPAECHFEQILKAFKEGLPVFCEKPLFWGTEFSQEILETKLAQLGRYEKKFLTLNTCNAYFLECVLEKSGKPSSIESFSFSFYTQGPHRGRNIGVDLLPHGLSLLTTLLGYRDISHISQEVQRNSHCCQFDYGDCKVYFDFREKEDGPKHLAFTINDREFIRAQKGRGNTYQVFLIDQLSRKEIETEDPFKIYISRFLSQLSSSPLVEGKSFAEGVSNLRMMSQICFGDS
jgi:hypothetical protein